MAVFPESPTDEVLEALVSEVCSSLSIFGRALGDGGPDEELKSSLPSMSPSISVSLVDAYCRGDSIYMPNAKPGVPAEWRTLREHELHRTSGSATSGGPVLYRFTEYLPDAKRLGSRESFDGVTQGIVASLVDGLKPVLGKPSKKQKQKVEFTWGGLLGSPTWGGLRIESGGAKEIKLGGGDAAPWGTAYFAIQLMGAPR